MRRSMRLAGMLLFPWLATACSTVQQGTGSARGVAGAGDAILPASATAALGLGAAKPGAAAPLTSAEHEWVERTLASLSARERIAQLIMPWVGGGYAAEGSPDFEQVRGWVEDDQVGGLVLSIGSPLSYALKLNALQRRADVPLLIASDMENGPGMRLGNSYAFPSMLPQGGGTVFPPVMALGATRSPELAFELGVVLGLEARAVGVHLAFGPVLDVNSNPLNPVINTRSFGEDPALVSSLATAYVRGARSAGLMTTAKHFPGHGDTHVDSHISLPTIGANRARLDSIDLPPFRAAAEAGIDAVMTAHIAVPAVEGDTAPPATLSRVFMTDILRTDLGFRGLLVTDAMTMGAVARRYGATEPLLLALEAGADVLLMPRNVTDAIATVAAAVTAGRIAPARIDRSVRKILEMKVRAGLHRGRIVEMDSIPTIVNVPKHVTTAAMIAGKSIVLARDSTGAVPLARGSRVLSLTYAEADDPIAGRVFDPELRSAGHAVTSARVDSHTGEVEYARLLAGADSVDAIVISAYVSPRAYGGSVGAEARFSQFVREVAARKRPVIAVSFGSPYLLSFFPDVHAYMLAWGGAPVSQTAAAMALLGRAAITGKLPVSIPPYNRYGDGLLREARQPVARRTR
ncbi:MAG: glycoside hydrolase family 3 N-terminal domain-containing protein [Gemmatimonadaceae bacterium]